MALKSFWQKHKVLIVMGPSLALIHWGWFYLKANIPQHRNEQSNYIPEPGIVSYVSPPPVPPVSPPPAKSK